MITTNVNDGDQKIQLGIRGENEANQVVFDLTSLIENYGNGTAVLMAKRSQDSTAYPCSDVVQSGNTLTWTLTDADMAYKGHGEAEIFWYVDEVLAKTIVYATFIANDIGVTTQTPPDPFETWVDTLTDLGAETLQNAQDAQAAQTAAETAQGKAEDAQEAAEVAQGKAEDAQEAAETAQGKAEDAQEAAETAQEKAETAQGKAEDAQEAAEHAEESILNLTASASVNNATGTPSVSVTVTESGGNKNMAFAFTNLKGAKGDTGATGETGATGAAAGFGTVSATVDANVGTPSVDVTASGSNTAKNFAFAFHNIKGQTGATGQDGVSPSVAVSSITGGHEIAITDANGTQTFDVMDGEVSEADLQTALYTKAPVITDSASGAIASFSDGADGFPVKELEVAVTPVQDLHGQANLYPAGGGKNLCPKGTSGSQHNITFTVADDGKVTMNSSAAASSSNSFAIGTVDLVANTTYALSGCPSGGGSGIYGLRLLISGSAVATDWGSGTTYTPTSNVTVTVAISYWYGQTYSNKVFAPQLELGSTPTAYAPYSNICPITGWTGANVYRTGKNLLNDTAFRTYSNWSDALAPYGSFATGQYNKGYLLKTEAGKTFTISFGINSTTFPNYLYLCRANGHDTSERLNAFTIATYSNNTYTFTAQEGWLYYLRVGDTGNESLFNTAIAKISFEQLEIGSTTTSYEPYVGVTYPISWQSSAGTVYGGTLDVDSGVLVVEKAMLYLDSNIPTGQNGFRGITSLSEGVRAEYYPYRAIGSKGRTFISDKFTNRDTSIGTPYSIWGTANDPRLYITLPSNYSTEDDFLAFFASNPTQVVYTLATPLTYQLTPTEVKTLLGENNIWCTTGDTSVTYCADTKKYIAKMIANALNA